MEGLFKELNTENGISGLLASVCVLMAIQMVMKLVTFLWKLKTEKDQVTEKTTKELIEAVKNATDETVQLKATMQKLEYAISELPKFKLDLKRLFSATKIIAGDKWPTIRDEIMKDIEL